MPVPVVTVVTPSYNQGCFIRATIESVLSQKYPHLEYIVMDGGSTDETAAVVKEYSSRLTFISERDRGQSHAINKGFQMARGSVLAWLNSDDLYLPGSIHAAVDAFDRNPSAGAVYGEGYLIDSAGKSASRFPWTQTFDLWRLTYLSDYILQQTVFFRRAALDEVGYLNECLHYTMDWDILIRLGKRYPVEYIPAYMACLREHPEAKTFAGGKRGGETWGQTERFRFSTRLSSQCYSRKNHAKVDCGPLLSPSSRGAELRSEVLCGAAVALYRAVPRRADGGRCGRSPAAERVLHRRQ